MFILIIYIFTVLWFTVFSRRNHFQAPRFDLFWSYKKWLSGDSDIGREILGNIAMFIPFGFLISSALKDRCCSRWKTFTVVVASAVLQSLTVEVLQLVLMRGLFEWDDVFSNTSGALIGMLIFFILEKASGKHFRALETSVGILIAVFCIVIVCGNGNTEAQADDTSRMYCFQVESAGIHDGVINMTGFAFRYEQPMTDFDLFLRSEKGDVKLEVQMVERPDVNDYFGCDHDYSRSGFMATGEVDEDKEYEIIIKWPWLIGLSTGVFVSDAGVNYAGGNETTRIDLDADFIEKGVLRVWRPDYHCFVYQYQGFLYWVVDSDFDFEDDGSTYIQYQLWTTQTDRLPENRLEKGYLWDNIGGYFEKYEVQGDFGRYRVMKRKLPMEYAITSIVTGYYKNGRWIWKEYFRPYYEL
ncbi:VanZ family protein [Oribacterium sp. WCC10]|uniref:VanZ family protein n=1 Tax=Oribacterium sp. WCC10 TaxID=1855343 RepID=UPI0015876895|nr:VanZ family protein [Oribacterium sp. WCC10]